MRNPEHEKIVAATGCKYLGTSDGLVWFDAPSHSTLVVPEPQFSLEAVQQRLAEHALAMAA
jgi:hypothetical protein